MRRWVRLNRRYATVWIVLGVVPALKGRPEFRSPLRGEDFTAFRKMFVTIAAWILGVRCLVASQSFLISCSGV
jgi:hypothetical protein